MYIGSIRSFLLLLLCPLSTDTFYCHFVSREGRERRPTVELSPHTAAYDNTRHSLYSVPLDCHFHPSHSAVLVVVVVVVVFNQCTSMVIQKPPQHKLQSSNKNTQTFQENLFNFRFIGLNGTFSFAHLVYVLSTCRSCHPVHCPVLQNLQADNNPPVSVNWLYRFILLQVEDWDSFKCQYSSSWASHFDSGGNPVQGSILEIQKRMPQYDSPMTQIDFLARTTQ